MFAFLNNSHEANIAVYAPDEQMKRAEIFRKIHEIEAGLKHQTIRLARADARPGKSSVKQNQPPWQVVRTEVDANNGSGQKHYLLEDGSILAQGYAPTLHTTQFTALKPVKTKAVRAVRLELLNDPSLPLQGPGPIEPRALRPDRVPPRGRARRQARPEDRGEDRSRHRRHQSSRAGAGADLRRQERPPPGHRPDRLRHRRQGGNRLGNRRRARPPECPAQRRVRAREARLLPGRNHPDLQARPDARRLEQRRQPEQQPGPVPVLGDRSAGRRGRPRAAARPRDPGHPARASGPPPRSRPCSATGAPPCRNGRRPTTRSRRSGSSIPRGRRNSSSSERDGPRETHMLERGDFLKPGKVVGPGHAGVPQPAPRRSARQPTDLRAVAGRPTGADDRPGDRQPDLAGLLRHRDRQHQRGPGLAVRAAVPSRAARLAGRRADGERLEPEASAPADRRTRPPIASRHGSRRSF